MAAQKPRSACNDNAHALSTVLLGNQTAPDSIRSASKFTMFIPVMHRRPAEAVAFQAVAVEWPDLVESAAE